MTAAVELFKFDHVQIRTVDLDGKRWAVAADICAALDIKDVSAAIARLDAADKLVMRRSDTPSSNRGIWGDFAPQVQMIGLVSEDGATDLVLDSRKPVARAFRRFLTHEVWPSIRDTGSYSTVRTIPQDYPAALREAAIQYERAELAESKVAVLEPKAEVADRLLDAEGDLEVADAAKALARAGIKTGGGRLFRTLEDKGWIYRARGDGKWRVNQRSIEAGLMSVLPQSHYHPKTGVLVLDPPQPRVTPKGLQRLLTDLQVSE